MTLCLNLAWLPALIALILSILNIGFWLSVAGIGLAVALFLAAAVALPDADDDAAGIQK